MMLPYHVIWSHESSQKFQLRWQRCSTAMNVRKTRFKTLSRSLRRRMLLLIPEESHILGYCQPFVN